MERKGRQCRPRRGQCVVKKEEEKDPLHGPVSTPSSSDGRDNVLLTPGKDKKQETLTPPECLPIKPVMGDDVPMYLTQLEDGSPIYLRQHPPTVEDMLYTSADQCSSFDGFSEASGSTFEGFSGSSRCSSVTFEGFLEESLEDVRMANLLRDKLLESSSSAEGVEKGEISAVAISDDETRAESTVETQDPPEVASKTGKATKKLKVKKAAPLPGQLRLTRSSTESLSKQSDPGCNKSTPQIVKGPGTSETIVHKKLLYDNEPTEIEKFQETHKKESAKGYKLKRDVRKVESITQQSRCSVDQSESESDMTQECPRKTRRMSSRLAAEPRKEPPSEGIVVVDKNDYIGDYCSTVGCTISFLESMKVKNVIINNGIVYELDEFAKRIAWERIDVARWIQRLSGVKSGEPTAEDMNKIHTILKRRKALKVTLAGQKIGNRELRNFDSVDFILPSSIKKELPEQEGSIFFRVKEEDTPSKSNQSGTHHQYQKSPELKGNSLLRKRKSVDHQRFEMERVTCDEASEKQPEPRCQENKEEKKFKESRKYFLGKKKIANYKEHNIKKGLESEKGDTTEKDQYENYDKSRKRDEQEESTMEENSERVKYQRNKKFRKEQAIGKQDLRSGTAVSPKDKIMISRSIFSGNNAFFQETKNKCAPATKMNDKETQETEHIESISEVKQELDEEIKVEEVPLTFDEQPAIAAGTMGVSKCGRLRKLSAKGINSIELKSLFVPSQSVPSTLLSHSVNNQVAKKTSCPHFSVKDEFAKKGEKKPRVYQYTPHQFKGARATFSNKYRNLLDVDNSVISFTFKDGHLVPKFKELDYYLGNYCCEAGVTVEDLNLDGPKDVDMTYGMVKELQDFYLSRGATKTSLAVRLFQMGGQEIIDYSHILTAVITITKAARTSDLDFRRLQKEFKFPKRHIPGELRPRLKPEVKHPKKRKNITPDSGTEFFKKRRKKTDPSLKIQKMKNVGKVTQEQCTDGRGGKQKSEVTVSTHTANEFSLDTEVVRTKGKEGSITRGDIVCLYTQWLKSKMAGDSSVFVTDLLKDVEKLMMERKVQMIRIPAGTLMSSSVKLHDEYKQMLKVSREDAMMYLEEDWLEDIQYLVSISGPSRRSTIDGENGDNSTEKTDVNFSVQRGNTNVISDSEQSEKSLVIDDSVISDDSSTAVDEVLDKADKLSVRTSRHGKNKTNTFPNIAGQVTPTGDASRSHEIGSRMHYMENIGKRLSKRRVPSHSLEDYDLEDFTEVQLEKGSKKQEGKQTAKLRELIPSASTKDEPVYTEEECEVDKIIDFQSMQDENGRKHIRYLVRWLGFGPEEDSWVDEANLQCPEILENYWRNMKRRKGGGRLSSRKKSFGNRPSIKTAFDQGKSTETQEDGIKDDPILGAGGHDKENDGNIIEAMIQRASSQNCPSPKIPKETEKAVTIRELLDLYDSWRQENQNVLMAGGSNTVNLETLLSRARTLMSSKKVKNFHPESLLNSCFMMTLMRTTLKTERALSRFLDSNCSEILEASYKQYLMTQRRHSNGEVPRETNYPNKKLTLSTLQEDFKRMQQDFSEAMVLRLANRNKLRIMEEELNCFENILKASQDGKANILVLLQQELEILKEDLNSLEENKNGRRPNSMVSNTKKIGRSKVVESSRPKTLITLTDTYSNKFKENVLQAGRDLIECGVPSHKVDNVIELVVNKICGRRLRAQPAGARSISEVIELLPK